MLCSKVFDVHSACEENTFFLRFISSEFGKPRTRTAAQGNPQRHGRKNVQTDTIANNGKPFLLAFFATWCKPCNRELKAIAELYDEWQQETGVRLIAVSVDQAQNINKVKPLVDQNGWQYDVLLDPNSELRHALGIQLIPYTVLLDGQGNIVYRHNGYTDGAELELYEKIKEIASK